MKPIHEAIQKTKKHHMHRDPCGSSNKRRSGVDLKSTKNVPISAKQELLANANMTFLEVFQKKKKKQGSYSNYGQQKVQLNN